jgi:prepilin peptidase CpaA
MVLWSRQLAQLLQNLKFMLLGGLVKMSIGQPPMMGELPVSVGKMPYAVAITVGTLSYLVWQRLL